MVCVGLVNLQNCMTIHLCFLSPCIRGNFFWEQYKSGTSMLPLKPIFTPSLITDLFRALTWGLDLSSLSFPHRPTGSPQNSLFLLLSTLCLVSILHFQHLLSVILNRDAQQWGNTQSEIFCGQKEIELSWGKWGKNWGWGRLHLISFTFEFSF